MSKELKTKNLLFAKKEGCELINEYSKTKDKTYLQKAMDIDNTNSDILYWYLNESSNKEKVSLYRNILNKDICDKLGVEYVDHKYCVISVLESIKNINVEKLDTEALKKSLEKYIPKDEINKYNLEKENTINNVPFNIEEENILYFIIKLDLGQKLYPIVDSTIDNNDECKDIYIQIKKECLAYIRILAEIILYYIKKKNNELVYNLISIIKFNEEITEETTSKIAYYLEKINIKNIDEIEKRTGFSFKKFKISDVPKCPDDLVNLKNIFFELIEKILKSKCIGDLIIKLKEHHNDKKDIIKIDENFIEYIKKNTVFFEFFKSKDFGLTNVMELKTFINIDYRTVKLRNNRINYLFNFCIWIISSLHEYIGHLLKDYYYYSTNFEISQSPKKKKENEIENENNKNVKEEKEDSKKNNKEKDKIEDKKENKIEDKKEEEEKEEEEEEEEEGGFLVEQLLFKGINQIYICDVLYILNIKNWEKNIEQFSNFFVSEERKNYIKGKKKIKIDQTGEDLLKLIEKFNLKIEELVLVTPDTGMECRASNSLYYINCPSGCGTHRKYNLF